jgi:hypothetical protein
MIGSTGIRAVAPKDLPVHFSPSLAPWPPFMLSPDQHRDIAAWWLRSNRPDREMPAKIHENLARAIEKRRNQP